MIFKGFGATAVPLEIYTFAFMLTGNSGDSILN